MSDNSIASPTPSAPPPAASTPAAEPTPSSTAELNTLEQSEDASAYAEQRAEDSGEINPNVSEAQRRFNRHQRKQHAIERLRAENEALRAQGQSPEQQQDAAPDADGDQQDAQGERLETPEEYQQRITEEVEQHVRQRENAAVFRSNQARFAAIVDQQFGAGTYQQALAGAPRAEIPAHVEHDLLSRGHWGPVIQFELSLPRSHADLAALLQATPREAERMLETWEAAPEAGARQARAAPAPQPQHYQDPNSRVRQATAARKPIAPLRGGAGPSAGLADLAKGEGMSMEAYARARSAQLK